MDCKNCQRLTEVIDELSAMLAKAQTRRRQALNDARAYRRLLVMDMESCHFEEVGISADVEGRSDYPKSTPE